MDFSVATVGLSAQAVMDDQPPDLSNDAAQLNDLIDDIVFKVWKC